MTVRHVRYALLVAVLVAPAAGAQATWTLQMQDAKTGEWSYPHRVPEESMARHSARTLCGFTRNGVRASSAAKITGGGKTAVIPCAELRAEKPKGTPSSGAPAP